jgi:hypothetical protein
MSSKVSINVKYPEIVVPDTDVPGANTPDTGMFSTGQISDAGISNSTLPIVGVSIISLVILVLIAGLIIRRIKDKKCKSFAIHHAGRSVLRIACLVTVLSLSAFALFEYGGHKTETVEAWSDGSTPIAPVPNTGEELSVTTEDININVTLDDTPVFTTTKSTVTVNAATTNGYTLMAYVDSNTSDLANETNTKATTKITGLESSHSQPLTDNTWGVALSLPEDQDTPVFRGLPTSKDEAMTIKVTGSTATPANDTAELYYATYVTPDLEEGTYTGATVNYVAISNPVGGDITVRYNVKNNNTGGEYELFNTVTYGLDCSMAYIGGNCQTAYAGEPVVYESPEQLDYGSGNFINNVYYYLEPIRITGADVLKINIEAGNSDARMGLEIYNGAYSSLAALESAWSGISSEAEWLNFMVYTYDAPGPYSSITKTIYIEKNALTLFFWSSSEYGNSLRATITPIYFEEPSGIETAETSFCKVLEGHDSDDDDSDPMMLGGELGGGAILISNTPYIARPVTLPGADRVRVEVTYDLPDGLSIIFAEGMLTSLEAMKEMDGNYSRILPGEGGESGSKSFDFSGDTITFLMFYLNTEDSFSFNVKFYPLYNDEVEDSVPVQTCRLVNKSGTYREPNDFKGAWMVRLDFDSDGLNDYKNLLPNENGIKSMLQEVYNNYRGQTIDVYDSNTIIF